MTLLKHGHRFQADPEVFLRKAAYQTHARATRPGTVRLQGKVGVGQEMPGLSRGKEKREVGINRREEKTRHVWALKML